MMAINCSLKKVPAGSLISRGGAGAAVEISAADSDGWIGFVASVGRTVPDCATIVAASDISRITEKTFFTSIEPPLRIVSLTRDCKHGAVAEQEKIESSEVRLV